jgi:hypothetical protein
MLYQMLRTKFSSIQGSSSPILRDISICVPPPRGKLSECAHCGLVYTMRHTGAYADSPESRLASTLALTVATSAAWRAHVALGRKAVAGGVHGLTHVAGLRGLVVHIALGLALELVAVAVVE